MLFMLNVVKCICVIHIIIIFEALMYSAPQAGHVVDESFTMNVFLFWSLCISGTGWMISFEENIKHL